MKCPHCRKGELEKHYHNTQLDAELWFCNVCHRGWHQDKDGNWHSHFAADVEVYSSDGKKLLDCSTWHLNEGLK
jgi:hypothetical protein